MGKRRLRIKTGLCLQEEKMLSAEEQERIGRECRTLNFIWLALVMSLFVYPLLGVCLEDRIFVPMPGRQFALFQTALYAVAPLTVVLSFFVRKLILSGKRRVARSSASGSRKHPAVALYATAMVVSLAMVESVGIYGFVLFLIGKNHLDLYVLTFVALALMLLYRPRLEQVVELAERLRQAEPADRQP
jgi:hypothetical protein